MTTGKNFTVNLTLFQQQYLGAVIAHLETLLTEGRSCQFKDTAGFWPLDLYVILNSIREEKPVSLDKR